VDINLKEVLDVMPQGCIGFSSGHTSSHLRVEADSV